MSVHMISNWMIGAQRCGKHEGELMLSNGVTGAVFNPSLWTGVGQCLKAKGTHVIVSGLFSITYIKLDVVGAFKWKKILGRRWS
jgi:hypothetical protein